MSTLAKQRSFNTTRYFGKRTDSVRQTRVINVPSDQLVKNGLTLPRRSQDSDHSLSDAKIMINESLSSGGGSNVSDKKTFDAGSNAQVKIGDNKLGSNAQAKIGDNKLASLLQWLTSWIRGSQ